MEIRQTELVEVRADAREIVGIAVPFGQTTVIRSANGEYSERFEAGSIPENIDVPVYYRHDWRSNGLSVGYIIEARSEEAGYFVTAKIHRNAKGDQLLKDVAEGRVKNFSIGFTPIEDRNDDNIVVRAKVDLQEVSLVESPAYIGATVAEVREQIKQEEVDYEMSDTDTNIANEFTEVRDSLEDVNRKIAVLEAREDSAPEVRMSFTDALVKAYDGEKVETRAISSTADNAKQNIWSDQPLGFAEQRRPLRSVFGTSPIPGDSGTTIEYAKVGTRAGTVAKQAAEGDALTYNKVAIVTATADIETFGGYAEFSHQALRFGKAPLLETTMRHLAVEYDKAAETKVRNALTGITNANLNVVTRGAVTGTSAASGWIAAVEDGLMAIEDNSRGLAGTHIVVSRDVHKALLTATDSTGRPLFAVNGDGSNTFGNVTPGAAGAAVIAGLPVVSVPQLAANSFYVVSSQALLVWEEGILNLSDQNIVNLTELRSLYGYLAVGTFDGKGVAKVTWA